jgi:hypothetical protein
VILARTVSTTGIQSITPVNSNGTYQVSAGASIGRDFRNRTFTFSLRFSPYVTGTWQRLLVNNNSGTVTTLETGPKLSLGFNWHNKVEFTPDYSYIINTSRYSVPNFPGIRVNTHQLQADLIIRAPWTLIWQTNVQYRYNNEVTQGLPKDNLLLNAAIACPLLRHNKGQLKLSVFDLLDRNNNFNAYTSGNAIVNAQNNVLRRYLMLTFTYNIQNLNPDNKPGRQRLFLF